MCHRQLTDSTARDLAHELLEIHRVKVAKQSFGTPRGQVGAPVPPIVSGVPAEGMRLLVVLVRHVEQWFVGHNILLQQSGEAGWVVHDARPTTMFNCCSDKHVCPRSQLMHSI